MKKVYLKDNVYEAFNQRLKLIFDNFDHIVISFSGGKDSGLLLELVHSYYLTHDLKAKKVSVFHLDYEGNYQLTKDYVNRCMGKFKEFKYYHVCLPISASCGVSMYQSIWLPWDPEHEELWVSELPKSAISLKNNPLPFFKIGMSDYDFQNRFCQWLHKQSRARRTAVLVGIRAQESLQRYHAVTRLEKFFKFGTIPYSRRITPCVFNFYPLYDWLFEDVWTANYRFGFDYNHLYDLYFQAGVSFKAMRVANPFHQCGVANVQLYRTIDPETWEKLLRRVNGVNFSSIYGKSAVMGYRGVKLPKGHTWKTYANFLLKTLPQETQKVYLKKFETSVRYWTKIGGSLPVSVILELEKASVPFENLGIPQNNRQYKLPHQVIRFKEYPDDIKSRYFRILPSYKRMCITILKNDTACQYMGFSQTKDELQQENR